jgi:hypothetical protein
MSGHYPETDRIFCYSNTIIPTSLARRYATCLSVVHWASLNNLLTNYCRRGFCYSSVWHVAEQVPWVICFVSIWTISMSVIFVKQLRHGLHWSGFYFHKTHTTKMVHTSRPTFWRVWNVIQMCQLFSVICTVYLVNAIRRGRVCNAVTPKLLNGFWLNLVLGRKTYNFSLKHFSVCWTSNKICQQEKNSYVV